MKRWLITGDEWLYYKVYTGYSTADMLLSSVIGQDSSFLMKENIINDWFFIRYADPQPHIRWRFHFTDVNNIGVAINVIHECLNPFVENRQINKIQTDTYKREVERYGEDTMELAERIFGADSRMVVSMLNLLSDDPEKENYRWLFSMKAIDSLLDDFQYSMDERHALIKTTADNFGTEFGINEFVIKQFSDKYRNMKENIFRFMDGYDENAGGLYDIIMQRSSEIRDIALICRKKIENSTSLNLNDYLGSLIHLGMNRIFTAQQRKHEVVLYGFLERYYRSAIAKLKYCKQTR